MDTMGWMLSGLLPAAIAAGACWVAAKWFAPAGDNFVAAEGAAAFTHDSLGGDVLLPLRQRLAPAVVGVGWAVAVSVGLLGQRMAAGDESPLWWPEDFWQRGYWWVLAAALVLGSTAWMPRASTGGRWVAAGLLAMATAFTSLPDGEGWEDTLPLQRGWMLLLSAACLLTFWSLDRLARRQNSRWFPLVVLALLAGPMLVAATTYGALVQWTIAAIAATLVCVGFAAAGKLVCGIGIAYPATAFFTVVMAAGRFYSYEDHPWWSYLGMLLIAPAVAIADRCIVSKSATVRVTIAASVAALMIAASAAWHLRDAS